MKNAFIFVSDNTEEVEAIATYDILSRAGINTALVSVTPSPSVTLAHNLQITTQLTLQNFNPLSADILVLPGGKGHIALNQNSKLIQILQTHHAKGKIIAAICAAPTILNTAGILQNLNYTCFPGFQNNLSGNYLPSQNVVTHNNIITAKSVAHTIPFALKIIELALGQDARSNVEKIIQI